MTPKSPKIEIPFDDFAKIVAAVEARCSHHGCGYRRRECREEEMERQTREWFAKNRNGHPDAAVEILLGGMDDVLPDYFRDRWKHKGSAEKLTAFRKKTYVKFTRQMA